MASSGGGNKKHNRNRVPCQRYLAKGMREQNKARRLRKHLTRFPADKIAAKALSGLRPRRRLSATAEVNHG